MFCKNIFALVLLCTSFSGHAADSSQSYQEEFVFLKTQLSALKARRTQTMGRLNALNERLSAKVFSLGGEVSRLQGQNEGLKTRLSKFDENRSSKDLLMKKTEVVSSQMREFVNGKAIGNEIATDWSIEDVNLFILGFLQKGAGLYSETSLVYNKKGEKTKQDTINLGHVASFAKNKEGGLTPLTASADKKDLFLSDDKVDDFTMATAGSLALTKVILKEGGVQTKAPSLSSVLREKLKAGGAVGYIIILLGFVGLGIAFIRFSLIRSYNVLDDSGIRQVVQKIQNGELETAKSLLGTQTANPLTRFVEKLISYRHKSNEVYEAIVIDEISQVQSKVSKYGPYLIVLAAVAPLLGLLGTVTGMIGTFDMITVHGTGNPKLLSGGIKEALVTTQMGLIVAIPCILAGNYLSSRALKVVSKFEEVASTLPKV